MANQMGKLGPREIDALEDVRILVQSRAQGPYGVSHAKRYSNSLLRRGMLALDNGDINEAIWLAEREVDFNNRSFGSNDAYSRSSAECLRALLIQAKLLGSCILCHSMAT